MELVSLGGNCVSQTHLVLHKVIIYCFTSRIFHIYGEVTIANEGLQNLGLRAFEQGGIFIVPHLL
jgi:hypothetical protein